MLLLLQVFLQLIHALTQFLDDLLIGLTQLIYFQAELVVKAVLKKLHPIGDAFYDLDH